MRIFVRKEDNGSLTVVVTDTVEDDRGCLQRFFRRGGGVVETSDPAPVADTLSQANDGFGGVPVPVGARTVWLGGVRTGMGRSFPGREGNFQYPTSVALSASPVPSGATMSFAGTPVALRTPPSSFVTPQERRGSFVPGGRGPSVFFDSARSMSSGASGESGESGGSGSGGSGDSSAVRDVPNHGLGRGFGSGERGAPAGFERAAARKMA